ncbi:hypothetical protein EDB85DRAFT_2153461 [Lactarius pseudohatsudake]|nr:hypothetical protein EDB85DRAFT_2153461 [Lactarius pseudohatsudake]
MSHFVQLSARVAQQSLGEVRAPGIVGLFVQGIQTGLVVSQWAQWLNLERRESTSMIALVVFVTVIGLLETGICFASAWRIYVLDFGQFIYPHWTDSVHVLLSTLTGAPIQALFIWRCYHILQKRIYVIIPLVLALITSVVLTVWVTVYILVSSLSPSRLALRTITLQQLRYGGLSLHVSLSLQILLSPASVRQFRDFSHHIQFNDILVYVIVLYSLTTFLRRIHTEQLRGRIMRFLIVVWQAAIPPGLCAVALVIKYMVFTETHPGQQVKWYGTIQAMLGKLYILSLFYTLNNRMDFTHRPPVTYASTVDPPSLESAGSPAQRRVYSVHFPDTEEC